MMIARYTLIAAILGVTLYGCASEGPQPPTADLLQRIQTARTGEDHESLASYYTNQAASARATAKYHREMGKYYREHVWAGRRGFASHAEHCDRLAQQYDNAAREYDAMAAAHHQMAEQARQ